MFLTQGTHYEVTDRWPVRMLAAVAAPLPLRAAPFELLTGDTQLARWDGKTLTILPGYACDGYSPVIRFCGRWLRLTPVPRAGLWPAVLHDALRQMLPLPGCPFTRKDSDDWFYNALTAGGLQRDYAGIYHGAVAGPVGTAWLRLTRRAPNPDLSLRFLSQTP